jgi:hypothetical protein
MTSARIVTRQDRKPDGEIGLTGYLAIAAMLAGVAQTIAIALAPSVGGLTYMDDAVVILLLVSVVIRLGRTPGWPVYLVAVFMMLMVFGAIHSVVPDSATFVLFRQVTIPVLLILVGMTLTGREWKAIIRLTIWIGIANALYMLLELAGTRLLNPVTLATYERDHLVMRHSLPAYYYYYSDYFDVMIRLGGTVLNPPVAGLVTGGALAFLWHDRDFKHRKLFLVLLAVTTVLTFGRGGVLVAAAAIVIPALIKRTGRVATLVIASPVAYLIGTQLADDGNSQIHARGLTEGFRFAMASPIGTGFGVTGNHLKALGLTRSSESLMGIAFAAGGIVVVILAAVLLWRLFLAIGQANNWEAAVGIGVLVAALFSESAGALNGTIPLWLAIGVALKKVHDLKRAGGVVPAESPETPTPQPSDRPRTGSPKLSGRASR